MKKQKTKKAAKSKAQTKTKKAAAPKKPAKKLQAKAKEAAPKKVTSKSARTATKAVAAKKTAAPQVPKSNERVGVLGGAFNPVHIGHLNSALGVRDALKLDKVILVPAFSPPHRQIVGPSAENRLEMVQAAVKTYSPELEASDLEIQRGGNSFTVDTLSELTKKYKSENLYFIMGADAFVDFPHWKNFPELLKLANFVVTTRPGTDIPFSLADLPDGITDYVDKTTEDVLKLTTGREIHRVDLHDINVSATDIRKRARNNQPISELVSPAVAKYIEEKGLYKRTSPLVSDYREFSLICAKRALDKKALSLKVYDLTKKNSYADYTVICSATSSRHASAIAEGLMHSIKEDFGLSPISLEGATEGLWVLIDYGALVIHIFQDHVRQQYRIENLWRDCPQIETEIKDATSSHPASAGADARNS